MVRRDGNCRPYFNHCRDQRSSRANWLLIRCRDQLCCSKRRTRTRRRCRGSIVSSRSSLGTHLLSILKILGSNVKLQDSSIVLHWPGRPIYEYCAMGTTVQVGWHIDRYRGRSFLGWIRKQTSTYRHWLAARPKTTRLIHLSIFG